MGGIDASNSTTLQQAQQVSDAQPSGWTHLNYIAIYWSFR